MGDNADASDPSQKHTVGIIYGIILFINATAGTGIVNFPQTFSFCGSFVLPILLLVVFAILTIWGLIVIGIVGQMNNCETMQDILDAVGGAILHIGSSTVIFFYGICSCTLNMIILGDFLDRVFYSVYGPTFCVDYWYFRREITIIIFSSIFVLPNIYSKKIDHLRYASMLGSFGLFYCSVMVIGMYFISTAPKGKVGGGPTDWTEVLYICSTYVFAFHCHIQGMPIFHCLRDKSAKAVVIVAASNYAICLVIYSLVGSFGYATFGNKVMSNILLNYDAKSPIIIIGLLLMGIKVTCAYPILIFCTRKATVDLYCAVFNLDKDDNREIFRRIIISSIIHCSALTTAVFVLSLGKFIGFLGLIVSCFIFVCPGAMQLSLALKNPAMAARKIHILSGISLIILGILIMSLILYKTILRLFSTKEGDHLLCDPAEILKNRTTTISY